jgi:hypothetical protein
VAGIAFHIVDGFFPDDAYAYYHRGISRQHAGDLDGALADDNQAIALDPKYAPVARTRRGYHSRGVLIIRPSSRVTARYSSVILTAFPFGSSFSKVIVPDGLDFTLTAPYQFFDFSQLMPGKAPALCKANRTNPELAFLVLAAGVDVGGFGVFVGKETKLVRSRNLNRWHWLEIAAAS